MAQTTCVELKCEQPSAWRDLCRKHYYAAGYGYTPKPCAVVGCTQMTDHKSAKGLCSRHYAQYRRTGNPVASGFRSNGRTGAEVLHERTEPHGDCVLWTGALSQGYGRIAGPHWLGYCQPHRFSWFLAHGPIPDGMQLDHVCHTLDAHCVGECFHRRCVNPDHLQLVTPFVNAARRHWRPAVMPESQLVRRVVKLDADAPNTADSEVETPESDD